MKIIKRNGTEVPFDITKIIVAVSKANESVDEKLRLSRDQITAIAAAVTDRCPETEPRGQRGGSPGYGGE